MRAACRHACQPLAGPAAGGLRDLAERTAKQAVGPPARPGAMGGGQPGGAHGAPPAPRGRRPEGLDGGRGGHARPPQPRSNSSRRASAWAGGCEALPADAAEVTILRSDQLDDRAEGAQGPPRPAVRARRPVLRLFGGRALPRAGLAPRGAARVRRRVRRRGRRAAGHQSIAGDQVVSASASTASVQPAIAAAWDDRHAAAGRGGERGDLLRRRHDRRAPGSPADRPAVAARARGGAVRAHRRSRTVSFAAVVGLLLWWGPQPRRATRARAGPDRADGHRRRGAAPPDRPRAPRGRAGDTMRWVRGGVDRSVDWARRRRPAGRPPPSPARRRA